MIIKLIFSMSVIFTLSGCFGLLSSDLDPRSPEDHVDEFIEKQGIDIDAVEARKNSDAAASAQKQQGSQKQKEENAPRMDPDAQKAGIFYGDAYCAVSDPEFWVSFWNDEDGDGSLENQAFYVQHGYTDQVSAEAAVKTYGDHKDFNAEARRVVAERCGQFNTRGEFDNILQGGGL